MNLNQNIKDIEGFEDKYAITDDGKIWSYPNIYAKNVLNQTQRLIKLKK